MEKRHKSHIDPEHLPAPINHDSMSRRINARLHPRVGLTVTGLASIGLTAEALSASDKVAKAICLAGLGFIAIVGYVSSVASRETRRVKKLQKGMLPPTQPVESAA